MARARGLAATARRRSAPNPWVGCVLVAADGEVVGEGATGVPGEAHAEAAALAAAGDRARGATAYVTLEPCSHHGRTPPCADALVAAGVARVVVGIPDPDPLVAGAGIARLRAGGLTVDVGPGAADVAHDLAPYLVHRKHGRSFATVKVAASIDGRIAAADGTSRWITGPAARADAHGLRADAQAVLVGSGTALADRPQLTVRDEPVARPPLRVVLDGRGRVPADGPLFDTARAPTLVVTTAAAPDAAHHEWSAAGAKVVVVPAATDGHGVDLGALLEALAGMGVLEVLVEGGGEVVGAFVAAGLADRLVAYVAPTVLGTGGRAAFAVPGAATLADAPRYVLTAVTQLGPDVRLDYVPAAG